MKHFLKKPIEVRRSRVWPKFWYLYSVDGAWVQNGWEIGWGHSNNLFTDIPGPWTAAWRPRLDIRRIAVVRVLLV